MTQLEMIHLRLAGAPPPGLIDGINRSVSDGCDEGSVRVFRHATVDSDLGIHISIETEASVARPSDLGLRLTAALREHGMVEHTVWIEARSRTTRRYSAD